MATVLIVDDDADMRLYVRGCIESHGSVRVVEAGDGVEALALARTLALDLVVSDVAMPMMSGIALCRALKANPETASVPVLLVSGEVQASPRCADVFLEKPFNAADLSAVVGRLLKPSS